jgi:hypothetical protein
VVKQWQKAEDEFDGFWATLGKQAYVFKFPDAAEIFGRVKVIGKSRAMPSDRLVTYKGETFYAEVKSTVDDRFKKSLLRKTQSAMAKQIMAAGGKYLVYVKSLMLNRWFVMSYDFASARPSYLWTDLESHRWIFPT